jgi:eukaryotic-like serine/threonine-protein kinase
MVERHSSAQVTQAAPSSVPPGDTSGGRSFLPGALVAGKYLVDRCLAEGGFGVVVVARQLDLQRLVAIKHLRPRALSNATFVERFQREARLAARLQGEHVVRVYDVGALPDVGPYIVMEYLEGRDLAQVAREGPAPLASVVDWILQACEGLAEAHALGIVHRDLKPDNLFLAQGTAGMTTLKVLDFGISKLMAKAAHLDATSRPTETGERFGTPVYMSPEQLRSAAEVDLRADVWSLGVVLFELITGELPFAGESMAQLCTSILVSPPKSLGALRPDVPAGVAAVVARCLEKDVDRRYANVADLAHDLAPHGTPGAADRAARLVRVVREGEGTRPSSAPAPSRSRSPRGPLTLALRHRNRWIAAGTIVGVAVAIALSLLRAPAQGVRLPPASSPSLSAPAGVAAPALPPEIGPTTPADPSPPIPSGKPTGRVSALAPAPPRAPASARPVARVHPDLPDDYDVFGGRK